MSEDFYSGNPEHLFPFAPARRQHAVPGVTFLIIRRGEPPVEADSARFQQAAWIGKPEDWFEDTDEIAPGVKVKFLGYGDQFDKDRNPVRGALLAVWDHASSKSSSLKSKSMEQTSR